MTSADVFITGGSGADGFGRMIAVGDVTGDGIADTVIGAPEDGNSNEGAIYVIFGATSWEGTVDVSSSSSVFVITGVSADDGIGSDLLLFDADGNGAAEIYTIKGANTIYKIDLADTASSGAGSQDFFLSGGGCQLSTHFSENTHRSALFWGLVVACLLLTNALRPNSGQHQY